jgi:hypothetical protein
VLSYLVGLLKLDALFKKVLVDNNSSDNDGNAMSAQHCGPVTARLEPSREFD